MSTTTRRIGSSTFPAIGFGALCIAGFYGKPEEDEERFKVLDAVHASGCTFWDTAISTPTRRCLLGNGLSGQASATTYSSARKLDSIPTCRSTGVPEHIKASTEQALKTLGVDYIDLLLLQRADANIPIEHSIGAMVDLVRDGKVKYIGISEVAANTLRRAHAVYPMAAVEMEYSPLDLSIEDPSTNLLATARELGIPVIAYSPLCRGLLTGRIRSTDELEATDFRRAIPRLNGPNFHNILKIADGLKEVGAQYNGATAAQTCLAWMLAQGDDIIPIPGTKKIKYLQENMKALEVQLSPEHVQEIRELSVRADAAQASVTRLTSTLPWLSLRRLSFNYRNLFETVITGARADFVLGARMGI
ncbi:NADP-dependent oxidoreductase domain-containing protein [Mycena rosella]|uniref:NADP-dependent oxidoreductase domain-containing protein n=1 Tax=Mycena rosella TaxID=1033263 RepID=A0AAD7DNR7_MYCRO|nr:NADP-dependent oxidoreductase domain-containing protein [Mycena rosella]